MDAARPTESRSIRPPSTSSNNNPQHGPPAANARADEVIE
jgi:hypothetical protein